MKRQKIETLEMRNISFSYKEGEDVFKNLNFSLDEEQILYVHGPKGSGKNTFLKLLLGLLPLIEGDFLINGIRMNDFSHQEFDYYRLSMGYAFDVGGLINNQTIYENFRLVLDYHDYIQASDRFDYIVDLLKVFDLDEKKHLRPSAVTASDQKAAVLLRSIILKPELLILDNPTQGLSTEHIPNLIELLSHHKKHYGLKHMIISSEDRSLKDKLPGKSFKVTTSGLTEDKEARRKVA